MTKAVQHVTVHLDRDPNDPRVAGPKLEKTQL